MQTATTLDTPRSPLGANAVKAAIAIAGLLVIMGIVSALPMVRDTAPVYHRSWLDLAANGGLFSGQFATDTPAIERALQEWSIVTQSHPGILAAAATTAAYRANIHAVLDGRQGATAASALHGLLAAAGWAIFPLDIIHAVIATLIFLVLYGFTREMRRSIEASPRFAELGEAVEMGMLVVIAALAYSAYQGLVYPLLGESLRGLYGWAFLTAGLVPLGLGMTAAARNLDAVTAAIYAPRSPASGPPQCPHCGARRSAGARFCPSCGGAASAAPTLRTAAPAAAARCQACGAEIALNTKFCGRCGQASA